MKNSDSNGGGSSELRVIGLWTAVAIVIANMVGTGVFTSLAFQVAAMPSGFPIIFLWLAGGIISLCGALCYAELGAMMPRSGGEYHLLREAWHPAAGFLAGWISITVGFAAPTAAAAVALGRYLNTITGVDALWFSIPIILAVTLLHLGKLSVTGKFQAAFTYGKVALIIFLAGAAFTIGKSQSIGFLPEEGDLNLILQPAFATSLIFVMYAYTGWNAAAYVAGEIENPQRNLPLALLTGTGIVTVLYVVLNAAFLHVTPIDAFVGEEGPVVEVGLLAAREIFGEKGGNLMGLLISFGLISTISSMTWAGPRVTAMIGEDYRLFRPLSRRNRFGVPAWAILIQSAIVIVLAATASFEQLINYIQAILILSSMMTVIAVIWLRIRRPDAERPYRTWGYPVTPLIFAAMSLYMLYFLVKNNPVEVGWGLVTLAIGVLVYFVSKAEQNRSPQA